MSDARAKTAMPATTKRLILRRWTENDREPFAALNADPKVMQHFPSTLSRADSDAMIDRIEAHFDAHGWGLWAVETIADATFIGFVGLWPPSFTAHFTPAVEIGWRLAHHAWGNGFASEAAESVLHFGFDALGLNEIVSFTSTENIASQRVMQRIGMHRDSVDDFDHPGISPGHRLTRNVLYRLKAAERDIATL